MIEQVMSHVRPDPMLPAKLSQALELRQLQLRVKEISKNVQHLQRGKYLESVSRDIQYDAEGAKSYLIEAQKRDADGRVIDPTSQPRIIDESKYVEACDGILTVLPDGSVQYKVCFPAGTLVHTDKGLRLIEQIRTGNRVLSQPEQQGELAYRGVTGTVVHAEGELHLVRFISQDNQVHSVLATANHPFWVQGQGWTSAETLQQGQLLELRDSSAASVHQSGKLYRTQFVNIVGIQGKSGDRDSFFDISADRIEPIAFGVKSVAVLNVNQAYTTAVYNFTVDGFHTYYVGEAGVWVHNTNCNETVPGEGQTKAIDDAFDKAKAIEDAAQKTPEQTRLELKQKQVSTCFELDTDIHTIHGCVSIQYIEVGTKVLSRCEVTGAQDYKQVTKVFEHHNQSIITIKLRKLHESTLEGFGFDGIGVTSEHPFWVKDVGWVEACNLKKGQLLEICDPDGRHDRDRTLGSMKDLALSGQRWNAEVISVTPNENSDLQTVYNFEVEDFHTYFVGVFGVWVHNKTTGNEVVSSQIERSTPYNWGQIKLKV